MGNASKSLVLFVCRPKQRQGMQVGGKRNDFGSGVKHHSANAAFACHLGHRLQTPNTASAQCGARFYFED